MRDVTYPERHSGSKNGCSSDEVIIDIERISGKFRGITNNEDDKVKHQMRAIDLNIQMRAVDFDTKQLVANFKEIDTGNKDFLTAEHRLSAQRKLQDKLQDLTQTKFKLNRQIENLTRLETTQL